MGHLQPGEFETRTNATFGALMWALSRPGLVRNLPQPGIACLVEALLDRECRAHADQEEISDRIKRTGAELVPIEKADHVFLQRLDDFGTLDRLSVGSDLYPETGATLAIPAHLGSGQSLRLSGPGVDGHATVQIDGVPTQFWSKRRAVMRYPMGFEVFLVDGDRVLGLPRTTAVEVI